MGIFNGFIKHYEMPLLSSKKISNIDYLDGKILERHHVLFSFHCDNTGIMKTKNKKILNIEAFSCVFSHPSVIIFLF